MNFAPTRTVSRERTGTTGIARWHDSDIYRQAVAPATRWRLRGQCG
jgi:hypothetical protein